MKDINFDFDKYNIRANDAAILKENAAWFAANPGKKVHKLKDTVMKEEQWNITLPLVRRGQILQRISLLILVLMAKLLDTVSYGKEKPLDPGHNEAAWAKNRRAQFVPVQ